jgi:hypothetical protein
MTIPLRPAALRTSREALSYAILHAEFGDLTLKARSGQVATLTRAATATVTESRGVNTFTLGHHVGAFEPRDWRRTGARTHGGLLVGVNDRVHYPANFRPSVCAGRLAVMMVGAMPSVGTALFSISIDAGTGARLVIDASSTAWRITHHNGVAQVQAAVPNAPVSGDSVELRWQLYEDGSVQLWQGINFAAETTSGRTVAPSSGALASSWGTGARVRLCALGTGNYGAAWWRQLVLLHGVPTAAQLERAA